MTASPFNGATHMLTPSSVNGRSARPPVDTGARPHHGASASTGDALPGVDAFDAERRRLEAAIAAARRRAAAARHRAASREDAARAALQTELLRIRQELADLERSHRAAVEELQQATRRDVERILDDAHRRVEHPEAGGGADDASRRS